MTITSIQVALFIFLALMLRQIISFAKLNKQENVNASIKER
jgi:hypothetical protein